jgi:hypothetical protein
MTDPIDYMALQEQLTQELNALAERIPFLKSDLPAGDRSQFANANVADEFVFELTNTIDNSPIANRGLPQDTAVMVDQRRFAAALALFESQARALADRVQTTRLRLLHESGTAALSAYAALQAFARLPSGQDLVPHLKHLRQVLGRGRPRKKPEKDGGQEEPRLGKDET